MDFTPGSSRRRKYCSSTRDNWYYGGKIPRNSQFILKILGSCGILWEFRKIYEISNFSVKSTSGRKLHPEIPIIPCATTTFPAGGDFL